MHLALGTVQFGMNYGIRGQQQPTPVEAVQMLDYATQNGIEAIDTAHSYGTAEDVVGTFLKKKTIPREKLFISSKFHPNWLDDVSPTDYQKVICKNLDIQLQRLHSDYLDAYLFHSSRYAFNEEMLKAMFQLKQQGRVKHCGVSVYYPEEAKACIQSPYVDFIQLPFSIFDQRMAQEGVFDLAKSTGKLEIHSRSAFIQGLILMKEDEIPPFLERAKPIVRKIDELCQKHHVSRISLAINFVKQFDAISHLVFGVDNLEQLKENVEIFGRPFPSAILRDVAKEFENIETDIVMPSLWVKK